MEASSNCSGSQKGQKYICYQLQTNIPPQKLFQNIIWNTAIYETII
jgi:hypothetical protein